jgi:wyosine [tRNA(Phe)-imidazoG37] synthetase (radical SAM superfamily)
MLEGIKEFTVGCKRVLIFETMLVQDVNTSRESTQIQLYFLKSQECIRHIFLHL